MSKIVFARQSASSASPADAGSAASTSASTAAPEPDVTAEPTATTATPTLESDQVSDPVAASDETATKQVPEGTESAEPLDAPVLDLAAKHRRRRALALVALGVVGVYGFSHLNRGPVVVSPNASTHATPQDEIAAVVQLGQQWLSAHGNFDGFAPSVPSGVLVGARGAGMVVSATGGSTCWYSGILPSGQKPIYRDSTNSACSRVLINKVVSALSTITVSH